MPRSCLHGDEDHAFARFSKSTHLFIKASKLPASCSKSEFWGGKTFSEVNAQTCAAYVKHRGSPGGARRDLETLRAAINHNARDGFRRGVVRVSLPPRGEARDRWLTRKEAAALVWHCWRHREKQTIHSGTSKGEPVSTKRRPLRHIARFILIGLGTRAGAIAAASPYAEPGRSYVDLGHGIFYPQAYRQACRQEAADTDADTVAAHGAPAATGATAS